MGFAWELRAPISVASVMVFPVLAQCHDILWNGFGGIGIRHKRKGACVQNQVFVVLKRLVDQVREYSFSEFVLPAVIIANIDYQRALAVFMNAPKGFVDELP